MSKHLDTSSMGCDAIKIMLRHLRHLHPCRSMGATLNRCASTQTSNYDYCVNFVKNADYENFICTLLQPSQIIRSAFAIRAFNAELASISATVREAKLGDMRLRFWRDRLELIYKQREAFTQTSEPITSELAEAIQRHNLTKHWLMRLISCREGKSNQQYQSVQDVETFGENSVASIYYLLFECLSLKNVNCDHAASHFAKAQIIANLIRSIPAQSKNNVSLIPLEMLVKYKISQTDIIRGTNRDRLADLIYDMCNQSNQHVIKTRKLLKQINNSDVSLIFLNLINIEKFLKTIEKYNFDIYNQKLHSRDGLLPARVFLAKLFKRI